MIVLMLLGAIFIFAFILAGFLSIIAVIRSSPTNFDFMLRVLAAGLGFFIYFAARVSGFSIPSLLLLSFDNVGGIVSTAILSVAPLVIGSLSSYILFKNIGKFTNDNDRAIYFLLMFMTLIQFMFLDVYITGLVSSHTGPHLLANASFVIGVAGTVLFNVNVLSSVKEIVNKFGSESPALALPRNWFRSNIEKKEHSHTDDKTTKNNADL